MKIAVVIPAYNEAKRIGDVLIHIPQSIDGNAVMSIVVDDGSRDETFDVASKHAFKALRHRTNLGKGAAAKTGCDAACKMGADIIVLMDADGQHSPHDIEKLVKPLLHSRRSDDGELDLVLGSRKRNKQMPLTMRLGNAAMNGVARLLFNIQVSDTQSGFRAFRRSAYPKIRWVATNYAMEMEMLILAYSRRLSVKEVEVATIYHDNYKGTTVLDGLRILKTLIKWKVLWFREYNSLESFSL